jgi:hypothetical protein
MSSSSFRRPDIVANMASALCKGLGQSVPETRASEDCSRVTDQPEGSLRNPIRRQIASSRVFPAYRDKRRHIARGITVPFVAFGRELLCQRSKVVAKIFRRMNQCDGLYQVKSPERDSRRLSRQAQ